MSGLKVISGQSPAFLGLADYVWVHQNKLHAKSRVIAVTKDDRGELVPDIQRWTTSVQDPDNPRSDLLTILSPCHYLPDPLRPQPCFITLSEVRDLKDEVVSDNHRAKLRDFIEKHERGRLMAWWGFGQEFQLVSPEGDAFPTRDLKVPREAFKIVERHLGACLDAGLQIHSTRWEDGRPWSFKVGYRQMPREIENDFDNPKEHALTVADHLWIARFLLEKVARESGWDVKWEVEGFTCRLYFSTAEMRHETHSTDVFLRWYENTFPKAQVEARYGDLNRVPRKAFLIDRGFPSQSDPYLVTLNLLTAIVTGKVNP